jgi:hypothetical protein
MSPVLIVILYAAFRVKHFLSDFIFQTDWMALTKGKPGMEGYKALFSHCGVHAFFTLIIVLIFAPSLWWLAPVDFVIHSMIDRTKGWLTFQRAWKPSDKIFWWSFGIDQEAHNFTHLAYIIIIVIHQGGIIL